MGTEKDRTDTVEDFVHWDRGGQKWVPPLLSNGAHLDPSPSSIVQSDQNVIKMIKRNSWVLCSNQLKRVMVNLEFLRNQGVPHTNICKYLIDQPRAFLENANRFKEIVEKLQDMGFNHLQTTFLKGIVGFTAMSEANWKNKMDVYKRWGWSEDHIQTAFRKNPQCMTVSEKKIMAVMNFLVNKWVTSL
ncbi:uncharacterized protein LOC113311479 [Papaver somniferum]|uniref:uncharacterized protein LOC113311479 n=1 Tax=Papaver somniferum TaxID=3469 RepID=UPI000E6F82AE|nr:uncharacterized protein LOC113311479 [Papaver somniferum]